MNLGKHTQFLWMTPALAALLVVACGRVESGGPSDSGTSPPADGGGFAPYHPLDSGRPAIDSAAPDAGRGPLVACGADAGPDGSTACALPPSDCLDEQWLRYYGAATCNEAAGICEYQISTMHCPSYGPARSCYQGGCQVVGGR